MFLKYKFKGKSDFNFIHGKVYNVVSMNINEQLDVIFINEHKQTIFIPYSSITAFNDNWEIVEE